MDLNYLLETIRFLKIGYSAGLKAWTESLGCCDFLSEKYEIGGLSLNLKRVDSGGVCFSET